jgi:hypothetical protein
MFKFLKSKKPAAKHSNPKRNPDFRAEYEMSDSVATAMDFFFSALHGVLPQEQQSLVDIAPEYLRKDWKCEYFVGSMIQTTDDQEKCRSVYFGSLRRDLGNAPFRVELRKRSQGEWQVVGFKYPYLEDEGFYAVFEPHYDNGRWETSSHKTGSPF